MSILFDKIRWKNFLSTGNAWTEIDFNRAPTTLISGPNGSGKSTLLDALTFVLFGKPFRKINKPMLLNSVNLAQCVVEVYFSVGNKKYKIIRGLKPTRFEIYSDGTMINQDAKSKDYQDFLEKQILKMNYKSFTQVVVIGSASFTPFMQLTAADRRSIIEDLLDIQIFSTMNTILKQKIIDVKSALDANKNEITATESLLQVERKHLQVLKDNRKEDIIAKEASVKQEEDEIDKIRLQNALVNKHLDQLLAQIEELKKTQEKLDKYRTIEAKLDSTKKTIQKRLTFFQEHEKCPTCLQVIEPGERNKHINESVSKYNELVQGLAKLDGEIEKINERIAEMHVLQKKAQSHLNEVNSNHNKIKFKLDFIGKLNIEIDKLKNEKPHAVNETRIKELKDRLDILEQEKERLIENRYYYDVSSNLLKDNGIKTKIIRQYIPIMNKLINKYLGSMDFFVNFTLDESFKESIKSRHRDEFSYESFSEGEKHKIDMALLFTWRSIAKMKNSVNTNLLILDETFDGSLDGSAIEELMKILNTLSNEMRVFVISHKGDILFDKFHSNIRFEKVGNFSRMVI